MRNYYNNPSHITVTTTPAIRKQNTSVFLREPHMRGSKPCAEYRICLQKTLGAMYYNCPDRLRKPAQNHQPGSDRSLLESFG
ncbi:hypothetical protein PHET_03197 [Paragonimus heterotremus]|uniref:Uncharacterized protein n=1 Tax=Paragonimus heterotremus TaxID=100268 RepID=A0A8J4SPH2_9TREM|nr:hypothetical protein PHET_03197 [Paragonimus heterotremus]